MNEPSTNGANGSDRDEKGRFTKGNPGGPGNPHVARVGLWRAALLDAVEPTDIEAVITTLVERAKAGEAWAVRELLDRCLGRPENAETFKSREVMEATLKFGTELAQLARQFIPEDQYQRFMAAVDDRAAVWYKRLE